VAESLAQRPDLVFVFRLAAMGAVLRSGCRPARMFFDLDDLEHKVKLRGILAPPVWPGKLVYGLHIPAIVVAERRAAAASERLFVCSERDRRELRRLGFGRNVAVVPNAIEIPAVAAPLGERSLMYLGSYSYRPNLDAAERLISRIWPLVQARVPDARLVIAGQQAERIPSFARRPEGVVFAGFVEDLDQLYAEARVIACPITVGGGTRVKLIEAAAYGKAMVSTRIGAEGLDFADGEEIVLSDTDADIAAASVRLLVDDAACAALGAAARAKAMALYDAPGIRRNVAAMLRGDAEPVGEHVAKKTRSPR
jgi:glycosyltransferase involved in cell wall biosynthesis